MKFSQVVGQEDIIVKLRRSVEKERVSHAQILAGPEGNGKLAIAIAFAQFVCCEKRTELDSCGVCPSCVKYEKLIHPDLHFVFPVFKRNKATDPISEHFMGEWREMVGKSPYFNLNQWLSFVGVENEQGLIYASEAAEIIKRLSLKPYESDYKVMIIWLPEKMHNVTANKLLKMIEEPPEKTLFLLVSEEPDLIIQTIMSRCQFIRIPSISKEALSGALSGRFDLPQLKADSAANSARGNLVRAVNMLERDEERVKNLNRFIELMRLSFSREVIGLNDWAEEISTAGRETQKRFLTYCLGQVRDNLMLNMKQEENNLVHLSPDEADFASRFSKFITVDNIEGISSEFTLAHQHISSNGNARIIFLDMALKMVKLVRQAV
jgi:DNA polymerase-3 subunit delta'